MIYVRLEKKGNGYVSTMIHYRHAMLNVPDEELLKSGVLVESLPTNEANENQIATLHADENKQLYWIYEDVTPQVTPEQEIEVLKQQNEELTLATIDLADTVAFQSAKLQEQEEALIDLANTLAEVMG